MVPQPLDSATRLMDALAERAKELKCLYSIAEVLTDRDLALGDVLQGVVDRIPQGWQFPDLCRARITLEGERFATAGFAETVWMQRVPLLCEGRVAGELAVAYLDNPLPDAQNPFLLEEKKLVEIIGQKVGQSLAARRAAGEDAGAHALARAAGKTGAKPEWRWILDLVRETDGALHRRLLRRLMNHLSRSGVPGMQQLIRQFDPAIYAARERDSSGANQPVPKRDMGVLAKLFDEVLGVAAIALKEEEVSLLVKQWIRQDRLGFLALASEKRNVSLAEIAEIVNRFCRETREGEPALSPTDEISVRVALARRFFSDSLPLLRVAREYVTIHDFGRLLGRVIGPAQGAGKLGGKAAGLVLASRILERQGRADPLLGELRVPDTWFITSDGLFDFLHYNSLEDLQSVKFASIEEVRHDYPYLEQIFKHSFFSPEMVQQMRVALEDLGDCPLIVRSSSLLEDSAGSAFSGKYRSLFLTNQGGKEERLAALLDAVAEVYASIFGPDPIQYRAERGLLDFREEMGVVLQKVVGRRVGKYFFPAFSGVGFSNNEFRWSPRLRREDGLLRLVAGLGTRAVDRVGDDFPALCAPGQPDLKVNVTPEQVVRYAQRAIDVLNLDAGRFESPPLAEVLRQCGADFPLLDKIVSIYDGGSVRRPRTTLVDPERDDLVVTFAGMLETTPFLRQMRETMQALQQALGMPVDVEFAHDGQDLFLLQCRPQSRLGEDEQVTIPGWVPGERQLFSAHRYVTNGRVTGIRYVVYVDAEAYAGLGSREDLAAVADAVSRLNGLLPRRQFILMGPGRWGSRGDISLGVGVTYAGICNTCMLIEIARQKGGYVPDLSFGTHFFQDLVEARIRYLALYPDEPGVLFAERFFRDSPSSLAGLLPEYAYLDKVVRVIDVPAVTGGCELRVFMDGSKDQALAFLAEP
ncbi:MAG: PEP/pyruvate-binding domain-containing protein [Deltaproteobacteria bacterium]|nr:PEP/pyruvate-binding domain-containing protein [Deltaproteobacteria bacterium]